MNKYIFCANIHPMRLTFNMETVHHFKILDNGIDGEGKITIKESKMHIEFTSEKDYSKSLEMLKNIVDDSARMYIDSYCYIRSLSYDLDIVNVTCSELDINQTFENRGEFNINKTDKEAEEELNKILILLKDTNFSFIRHSFADFRRSIKYPSMTALFCFKAIETVRKFYFEKSSIIDEKKRVIQGWEDLRRDLNFSRKDFNYIEKFAIPNRHGDYPHTTYQEREKIMNFTRQLIDRFIDFSIKIK